MTTDHEQLLKMRRLLKEAAHIGRQVWAQLLQLDTHRANCERAAIHEANDHVIQAIVWLEDYAIPNTKAAPIELADLCDESVQP